MATKHDLPDWVHQAIQHHGGRASIVDVAKHIWQAHERELRASGDLFYTWQYDMRWAANSLRSSRKLRDAGASPRGVWETA